MLTELGACGGMTGTGGGGGLGSNGEHGLIVVAWVFIVFLSLLARNWQGELSGRAQPLAVAPSIRTAVQATARGVYLGPRLAHLLLRLVSLGAEPSRLSRPADITGCCEVHIRTAAHLGSRKPLYVVDVVDSSVYTSIENGRCVATSHELQLPLPWMRETLGRGKPEPTSSPFKGYGAGV